MEYLIKSDAVNALKEDMETSLMCYDDKASRDIVKFCYESMSRELDKLPQYILDGVAEVNDLEENGLLLKLPCNVGDVVYTNLSMHGWYFRKKDRPYKAKIVFIGINGSDNFMNVEFEKGHMLQFKFSQIGKTIFLTKNEAEEALQKMNEHDK